VHTRREFLYTSYPERSSFSIHPGNVKTNLHWTLATPRTETASIMVNIGGRVAPLLAAAAVTLFSASGVEAHGHHEENIPEGKYISEDPIVR
jgi:hypothetical protein